jgi:hypothetical protein
VVRGVVVLVQAERELARWPLELPHARVDLRTIDYLARLQLVAKAAGCEVRLSDLCPRVRELLDLAGLADWVWVEVER